MNWTWTGGWWMPMGFMGMMFLLMAIGCVVMMVFMRRGHGWMPCMPAGHGGGRALDILRERYAKGEIAKTDFDRLRQDLG